MASPISGIELVHVAGNEDRDFIARPVWRIILAGCRLVGKSGTHGSLVISSRGPIVEKARSYCSHAPFPCSHALRGNKRPGRSAARLAAERRTGRSHAERGNETESLRPFRRAKGDSGDTCQGIRPELEF